MGAESAAAWERALLGALLIRPRLIRAFAERHPPGWFTDAGALEIMRGLFCIAGRDNRATVDDLIHSLERHGALAAVGGPYAIRALAAPRPALDAALRELDALLERLPATELEQILRDEELDDLPDLIAADQDLTELSRRLDEPRAASAEQLVLFVACPLGKKEGPCASDA